MSNTSTVRMAAGKVWQDASLGEWPENDYRVFVGNLGNEVTDEMLSATFKIYKSFHKAKVVRDKRTMKTRGYGFVSFLDPVDMLSALREINNKYIGNRPCMLKRSKWEEKAVDSAKSTGASIPAESSTHVTVNAGRVTQKFKKFRKS